MPSMESQLHFCDGTEVRSYKGNPAFRVGQDMVSFAVMLEYGSGSDEYPSS